MKPAARFLGLALLVAAGSAVGTLARAALELAFAPAAGEWPWVTFAINLVGSFVLGALLEALAFAGDDTGRRRMLRLGLGTGILGGFTTYSTFVLEIDHLALAGHGILAAVYAVGSIALGIVAAALGAGAAASVAARRRTSAEDA